MAKHVQVIDRGWLRIRKELDRVNNAYTVIGHIASDSGQDNVTKAVVNEYGSKKKNIPSRPFNRKAFDKNKKEINTVIAKLYDQVLKGDRSVKGALSFLGEWYVGVVKKQITSGNFVKNMTQTILRKKSSKPLIHTGEMRNSVTHKEFIK